MPFAAPHTKADRRNIVSEEMHRWGQGKLHSGSPHGPIVKNQKQAVAIGLSEAGLARKAFGGEVAAFHEMSPREKTTSGLRSLLRPESPRAYVGPSLSGRDHRGRFLPRFQGGGGILGLPPDIAPSPQSVNPIQLNQIQRFQGMPTEKLRELSVALGANPEGNIVRRVLQSKQMQPGQGITPPTMAEGGDIPHMQMGGIPMSMADPPWERHGQVQTSTGFLLGSTPGRADQVNVSPPAGSYVWPADVIAGLGEGNSLAGATILEHALRTGPRGTPLPPGARGYGVGIPRPPPRFREPLLGPAAQHGGRLNGHDVHSESPTPIMAAHGEYISTPDEVRLWGRGNLKRGHDVFDQAVVALRKEQIEKLKKLKGPVKS